jgi:hypothetical protein
MNLMATTTTTETTTMKTSHLRILVRQLQHNGSDWVVSEILAETSSWKTAWKETADCNHMGLSSELKKEHRADEVVLFAIPTLLDGRINEEWRSASDAHDAKWTAIAKDRCRVWSLDNMVARTNDERVNKRNGSWFIDLYDGDE